MRTNIGDLIVAVYDEAERYTDDPETLTKLAAAAVEHILAQRQPPRTSHRHVRSPVSNRNA